jgi:hypothetical protein
MQSHTIFFIIVNALHVSGGFSPHHQQLKTVHAELELTHVSGSSKQV